MQKTVKIMFAAMLLILSVAWGSSCSSDDAEGFTIAQACKESCAKLIDLCDDITDADECESECAKELADSNESELMNAKNCVLNSGSCEDAMACGEDSGVGDDITIEVVVVSGSQESTSAQSYIAFFSSEAEAQKALDTGSACAVASYEVQLNGDGILKGTKSITLPEGTYYVIGFVDFNGNGCLDTDENIHSYIKTYKFEEWMVNDVEDARKIQLTVSYDGSETVCFDLEDCGGNEDGDDVVEDGDDVVEDGDDVVEDGDDVVDTTGTASMTVDGEILNFDGNNVAGACWTMLAGYYSCSWVNGMDQIVIDIPVDAGGTVDYSESDYPLTFKISIDLDSVRYVPTEGHTSSLSVNQWNDTTIAGVFSGEFVEQYGEATLSVSNGTFTGLK